jgi:hypothetical protein
MESEMGSIKRTQGEDRMERKPGGWAFCDQEGFMKKWSYTDPWIQQELKEEQGIS